MLTAQLTMLSAARMAQTREMMIAFRIMFGMSRTLIQVSWHMQWFIEGGWEDGSSAVCSAGREWTEENSVRVQVRLVSSLEKF